MKLDKKARIAIVASVIGFIALGSTVMVTTRAGGRFDERKAKCFDNVRTIRMAIYDYAVDHGGNYPDRLSLLYPQYIPDLSVFLCPGHRIRHQVEEGELLVISNSREIDPRTSYRLVPGVGVTSNDDAILLLERGKNHGRQGHALLHADLTPAWYPTKYTP